MHVILDKTVYLYQVKAPFSPSGVSVKGALEYDEAADKIKCHECGEWHKHLGRHVRVSHKLSAREYKIKHGLKITSGLISEGIRKIQSADSSARNSIGPLLLNKRKRGGGPRGRKVAIEGYNVKSLCPAQILDKLRNLRNLLGRPPCYRELKEHGISPTSTAYLFGSIAQGMKAAGIKPPTKGEQCRRYSSEQMLEFLRNFYRNYGHPPRASDFGRRFLPSRHAYTLRFGSLRAAWAKTGMPPRSFSINKLQAAHCRAQPSHVRTRAGTHKGLTA